MAKFDVKTCVSAAHIWDENARSGKRIGKLKPSKIRQKAKRAFARMQKAQAEAAQAEIAKNVAQTDTAQAKEEK